MSSFEEIEYKEPESSFSQWIAVYSNCVEYMYERIFLPYLTSDERKNMSIKKFARFVYNSSSKRLSDYV